MKKEGEENRNRQWEKWINKGKENREEGEKIDGKGRKATEKWVKRGKADDGGKLRNIRRRIRKRKRRKKD